MKTLFLFLGMLLLVPAVYSHNGSIRGSVFDAANNLPLGGATVSIETLDRHEYTDELGFFQFNDLPAGSYELMVSYLGYELLRQTAEVRDSERSTVRFAMKSTAVELQTIVISPEPAVNERLISSLDIRLRPSNSSQDILRLVPGLFIAQHAGGGKAEQIFLRGFDIDHGTDIALTVDGMPVNMVSHAHGQGYADLHFLIPETVERVQFTKGPYYAYQGNMATAGFAGFQTKNALERSTIRLQAGQFDSYRLLGMFNLINPAETRKGLYLATEYNYSNGYFESPQAFSRFNAFLKYHAPVGSNSYLSASASTFASRWDASGQIPERAVRSGLISRRGAIDDTEGGATQRSNANVRLQTLLPDGSSLQNQFYLSRYDFELYSNFTFFLNDPENGDQIRQKETRYLTGYNGVYRRSDRFLGVEWESSLGLNIRYDAVNDNELSRTAGRRRTLSRLSYGDVTEINAGIYLDENIRLNPRLTLNAGVRLDQFQFMYVDQMQEAYDRQFVSKNVWSPKLNAYYTLSERVQIYANSGLGFHSNDTRVVVAQNGREILPQALGLELGALVKVTPRLLINTSLWRLNLEQEFVYVGDESVVEPSGKTRRSGVDLAGRWQFNSWLFADFDLNYTLARATGAPEGKNYIPLAPDLTSAGGIFFQLPLGLNGSLRYRYLGKRPANEDRSVIAQGYYLLDAVVNYTRQNWEIGLMVQNLLDRDWKEAQFNTESRLRGEPEPVSEIHYTPGTPFNLQFYFSYSF